MACVEIPSTNGDSEMEEGEIVDDVDELSDISSEEEFLLRQRLQVLENYNNVLERKQAKNEISNSKRQRKEEIIVCDLSDVSETDLEDNNIHVSQIFIKKGESIRPHKKRKQTKGPNIVFSNKIKDCKKKSKQSKKRGSSKVHVKSSDDSDDEYCNKRRRLANAVTLKKNKHDTSTLKDRINRMLFGVKKPSNIIEFKQSKSIPFDIGINKKIQTDGIVRNNHNSINQSKLQLVKDSQQFDNANISKIEAENVNEASNKSKECTKVRMKDTINLCTDNESSQDVLDAAVSENVRAEDQKEVINENKSDISSDEDLELLREYALKTKHSKSKTGNPSESIATSKESKPTAVSEDEDSDTAELRLICLKSSLLKKAIEMKQKQKLRKRLSQSSCIHDDITLQDECINVQSENNTDIESVDMDIGSDGEEKTKENANTIKFDSKINDNISKRGNVIRQDDELEEDEDLLRAKLLTSLSKNLPNLTDLSIFNEGNDEIKNINNSKLTSTLIQAPEEKKIIINVGESDSEEHEATKNLTKMHMKLAEHYNDFQSKLDNLLKSTRKEFEKDTSQNVVQKTTLPKPTQKFVPKAMNHLPKSEQIEYKNLVKRMAELEKIKQARNSLISSPNKTPAKETLKPRNISLNALKADSDMEEKIALSRKKIAEESAKILKLKEEAKKLSQKYKIVATELRNISTAINFNKKQQRAVHNNLQQIRLHHQLLLKGSTPFNTRNPSNKLSLLNKIQKENNPKADDDTYTNLMKSMRVSFVNDMNNINKSIDAVQSRLSVQLDVANNKKTIKLPKSPPKARVVDIVPNANDKISLENNEQKIDTNHPLDEKGDEITNYNLVEDVNMIPTAEDSTNRCVDDYKSPLVALGNSSWDEDPNAFLCPYDFGGSCRDPECKYLHPKIPSSQ